MKSDKRGWTKAFPLPAFPAAGLAREPGRPGDAGDSAEKSRGCTWRPCLGTGCSFVPCTLQVSAGQAAPLFTAFCCLLLLSQSRFWRPQRLGHDVALILQTGWAGMTSNNPTAASPARPLDRGCGRRPGGCPAVPTAQRRGWGPCSTVMCLTVQDA